MTRTIWLVATALVVMGGNEPRAQQPAPRVIALAAPNATLPAEFNRVGSVRELADGRTLITDGQDGKLFVGDWSKGTLTQIGRIGSGPREYARAGGLLALAGDSTLMPDGGNGRWLLLHGAAIVGIVASDAPVLVNGAGQRQLLGADLKGRVLVTRPGTVGADAMFRRDTVLLVRIARLNGRADTVAAMRARPSTIRTQGPANKPTMVSVSMNPFATGELATLFPDGWIAIARLDPYRVEWITPDGKHVRGPALPFETVRLDDREIHAYLKRVAERNGTQPRDPASFPPWPEVFPPFTEVGGSVSAGPGGMVWIRRPTTAASTSNVYDVIDRRGSLVARVTMDKDTIVDDFGRDAVYTIATDDDGIQHLQRRPVPKF